MIDPNSDELYDELRRKLADYGSQPSEEVWATIRQRVPAKPAPALRAQRRTRRRTLIASLLFLLISGVLVAYYYQVKRFTRGSAPISQGSSATIKRLPKVPRSSSGLLGHVPTAMPTPPTDQAVLPSKIAPKTAQEEASSSALRNGSQPTFGQQTAPSTNPNLAAAQKPKTTPASRSATRSAALAIAKPAQLSTNNSTRPTSSPGIALQQPTALGEAGQTPATTALDEPARAASATLTRATLAESTTTAALKLDLALLQTSPVSLALPPMPTPLVTAVPTPTATPPPPPSSMAPRLAVQLLAGPALSYRYLGRPGTDSLTSAVERLERPAESYSAELGLTYALTPRLTVLTGLGYTEYATRLDLTVKQPVVVYASFQRPVLQYANGNFNTLYVPDSVASGDTEAEQRVRHRDVYRFVSVPLQVQYELGTAGRFGYGLMLGASANLYMGGSTTQAGGCGCEQDKWQSGNSPFRLASLGLMAGTTIRYRLAERWHLHLQPTFNYLLTPLAQDQTRSARHLLSAGMRTGVSFDLR